MTTNKNNLIAITMLLDEEESKSAVTKTLSRKRRRFGSTKHGKSVALKENSILFIKN